MRKIVYISHEIQFLYKQNCIPSTTLRISKHPGSVNCSTCLMSDAKKLVMSRNEVEVLDNRGIKGKQARGRTSASLKDD